MNDAQALLDHQAQKREINMIFPHSGKKYFVKADRIITKQIFVNLLSNAIKYNSQKVLFWLVTWLKAAIE